MRPVASVWRAGTAQEQFHIGTFSKLPYTQFKSSDFPNGSRSEIRLFFNVSSVHIFSEFCDRNLSLHLILHRPMALSPVQRFRRKIVGQMWRSARPVNTVSAAPLIARLRVGRQQRRLDPSRGDVRRPLRRRPRAALAVAGHPSLRRGAKGRTMRRWGGARR